ncbi:MAG: ABC transporter ATP-binding protein [Spirochaetaceae bacterium]
MGAMTRRGQTEYAISADGLSRRFGSFTAVDGIELRVSRGEIFGLLGANGAGKSTTIRMLCGLLRPTAGHAQVAGHDIEAAPDRIKERIGYMSQEFSLYHDLTVAENIRFFGGVYGLGRGRLEQRLEWAVDMAGLAGREDELAGSLSGGFRQRLALGCAILHDPEVVFLDEPTGGVDPAARRDFWHLINGLSAQGTTILVTTHYLDEAEYCQEISLMHAGSIVESGTPTELKARHPHAARRGTEAGPRTQPDIGPEAEPGTESEKTSGETPGAATGAGTVTGTGASASTPAFTPASTPASTVPTLEEVFVSVVEERNTR